MNQCLSNPSGRGHNRTEVCKEFGCADAVVASWMLGLDCCEIGVEVEVGPPCVVLLSVPSSFAGPAVLPVDAEAAENGNANDAADGAGRDGLCLCSFNACPACLANGGFCTG